MEELSAVVSFLGSSVSFLFSTRPNQKSQKTLGTKKQKQKIGKDGFTQTKLQMIGNRNCK